MLYETEDYLYEKCDVHEVNILYNRVDFCQKVVIYYKEIRDVFLFSGTQWLPDDTDVRRGGILRDAQHRKLPRLPSGKNKGFVADQ